MQQKILNYNDKLFIIKKILRDEQVLDSNKGKEFYHSDIALRHDGFIYFAQEILEPEIIEETITGKFKISELVDNYMLDTSNHEKDFNTMILDIQEKYKSNFLIDSEILEEIVLIKKPKHEIQENITA